MVNVYLVLGTTDEMLTDRVRAQETRLRRKEPDETNNGEMRQMTQEYVLVEEEQKLQQALEVTIMYSGYMKRLNLHPRERRGHDLVRGRNGYWAAMNGLGRSVIYGELLGCIQPLYTGVMADIAPQPLHKVLPRHFRGRFSGPCAVQPHPLVPLTGNSKKGAKPTLWDQTFAIDVFFAAVSK